MITPRIYTSYISGYMLVACDLVNPVCSTYDLSETGLSGFICTKTGPLIQAQASNEEM